MRPIGEKYFPNDIAGISVQDVDLVSRAPLPGRNIKQLTIRIDRQPIDARTDRSIPEYRVVIDVQAIDHPDARNIDIGNVKLPSSPQARS